MNEELVKQMVDRFLGWKLPKDFSPDCHIHFDREAADAFVESWPTGTNLLSAPQAEAMFRHVLGNGYCSETNCVCGGDTQRVREGCANWRKT